MCGVCGIVVRGGVQDSATAEAQVSQMVDALAHRGPDDSGVETVVSAIFGATRLAIRGLINGHQPLVDDASGVVAVCNGEIDNHKELRAWLAARGREVALATDIAVIPGLYLELGEAFVERLTGVFAIALWDPRVGKLILARDRAGERPLFYIAREDKILFATEIAALAADRALELTPDRESLAGYLAVGAFPAPSAPFAEIRKVAPAEIVSIDESGIRQRRYWRWSIATGEKREPSEDEFDAVFRGAVERQSDVDVPFAVFLSGGVDSSLVASVLKSVRPDVSLTAYTLRFRESSYDEGDFATEVAEMLGIQAVTVWCEPEHFPSQIAGLIETVGEPLADPAWVPTAMLARRAAQDVKLCLVGEGGDELFGGYPTYLGAQVSDAYLRWPSCVRKPLERIVHAIPPSDKKMTLSFLLKRFVDGAAMEGLARHELWTSSISPALRERLGASTRRSAIAGGRLDGPSAMTRSPLAGSLAMTGSLRDTAHEANEAHEAPEAPGASSAAGRSTCEIVDLPHRYKPELLDLLQRRDLETTLAEGLLTKADRASMQSALELRAPFLDRHVMEFAATLPVRDRVAGFETKAFLKRYARRYLPKKIVYRRKRGLSVPLASWLRGPLESWARASLVSGRIASIGLSNRAALEILDEHLSRRADHARALWTLLVLSEWIAWSERRGAESTEAAR
jgi:asparagine synthase (glutamine-hydrolysing)